MPKPQFNKEKTENYWFNLLYQSNTVLNDLLHNQTKRFIAEILITEYDILEIHSYIHGQIIFRVDGDPLSNLDSIIDTLTLHIPLFKIQHEHHLLFSIDLVTRTKSNKHLMYIDGSDDMEENFRDSISNVFPLD